MIAALTPRTAATPSRHLTIRDDVVADLCALRASRRAVALARRCSGDLAAATEFLLRAGPVRGDTTLGDRHDALRTAHAVLGRTAATLDVLAGRPVPVGMHATYLRRPRLPRIEVLETWLQLLEDADYEVTTLPHLLNHGLPLDGTLRGARSAVSAVLEPLGRQMCTACPETMVA